MLLRCQTCSSIKLSGQTQHENVHDKCRIWQCMLMPDQHFIAHSQILQPSTAVGQSFGSSKMAYGAALDISGIKTAADNRHTPRRLGRHFLFSTTTEKHLLCCVQQAFSASSLICFAPHAQSLSARALTLRASVASIQRAGPCYLVSWSTAQTAAHIFIMRSAAACNGLSAGQSCIPCKQQPQCNETVCSTLRNKYLRCGRVASPYKASS